jgi:dihydrofolate reductase
MGRLIYSMSVSLDGFVATPSGSLDWVQVDEELHSSFNDEARESSAFLYGRRMWELMAAYWPTADTDPAAPPTIREFAAIWKDTPKIVFSRTLERVDHGARLVRDDAVAEVARLKAQPDYDMSVGGPTITAPLLAEGLVDEVRLYVQPVILGAGLPFLPPLDDRIALQLVQTRTLDSGVVYLRYETSSSGA